MNSIPHSFGPAPDAGHTWTKGGVPTDNAGTIIYEPIEEVQ